MGDRGNIVIRHKNDEVWLYTHWGGTEIDEVLKASLAKAPDRWTDPQYLARVVFQSLVGTNNGTTGYGISSRIHDNEHDILVADCESECVFTVKESALKDGHTPEKLPGKGIPFAEYTAE